MRLLTARNSWRRLGDFGHLAHYTANKSAPGSSNGSEALNRFAHFKLFSKQVREGNPAEPEVMIDSFR